ELVEHTDGVWHGHLAGAGAGLVYGYRVDGPSDPERGLRCNVHKLLLDPYAKKTIGAFHWTDAHLDTPATALQDNARYMLKAVVAGGEDDAFDWQGDRPPATPLDRTVIYEVHVKGFTARHPQVPEALRGTYEGFASPAAIAHLQRLGVTAVELLPVHQAIDERPLAERGLNNYWGYNTLGFFAPDRRFARSNANVEFKAMVRALHAAGIEVILDVVYNHTAEGDHRGPTLSLRGFDNRAYYHLRRGVASHYENYAGTGNALNVGHPRTLQLVMDSLRYWVTEMHVDGFRFDLATTLGRRVDTERGSDGSFDRDAAFFQAIRQDPVLSRVKLIAEPWDAGMGGYQLGRFPSGWTEWNDRYRDTVRSFWIAKGTYRGELAARLAGSSEQFRHAGRRPQATLNYVTAHDGFTLQDLVSYSRKHNEANGEDNRDGSNDNRSWNCGIEGPTDLLAISALRSRLKRALLATLLMSQGVPMLLGGDELGRTQSGNNNAYNQDNETSWYDWDAADQDLIAFTAWMLEIRRNHPQLRQTDWLLGQAGASGVRDAVWINRRGDEMTAAQWQEGGRYCFGLQLGARNPDEHDLLIMFNAEASDWTITLPAGGWRLLVDTGQRDGRPTETAPVAGPHLLKARSLTLFQRERTAE
ncbi:MAG: glycogen debranching protein GlgX, partial [Lautropia sp.]